MAGTNLYRSTTTRTNDRKFTFSCWFKKSTTGTDEYFVTNYESGNDFGYINNGNTDKFVIYDKAGGTERLQAESNFVIRDTNAWYHLVYSVDSTASSNRVKFYINGVDRFSDFTVATAMAQNVEVGFQKGNITNGFKIGSQESGIANYNGLMSHVNFVDGLQLDASAFGETDSTTGEWKIKTSPTVSEYGNNGFFILKDGNSVTDQSGKGNNFGIGGSVGSLTKSEDCPSNVFCTLNPLARGDLTNNAILSNGNTYYSSDQTGYNIRAGTIGANKGKFYWEGKFISHNPQTSPGMPLGIIADNIPIATNVAGGQAPYYYAYNYDGSNGTVTYNSSDTNYGTTILNTVGQIGMVALDLDNNKVYFGVNGTWTNSGNPANGTNGYSIIDPADTPLGFYLPAVSDRSSIREYVYAWNFGNGYFGTTAVSSAGTNASENGIFEYDCPAGFTALSTEGLNL